MLTRSKGLRGASVSALCTAALVFGGLASSAFADCGTKDKCAEAKKPCNICGLFGAKSCGLCAKKPCGLCAKKPACATGQCPSDGRMTADLPPNAQAGECYAKVIVPAQYKTVTERFQTQEASERIEVNPAQYKWVEERIMSKEASTQLEVVPAEYKWTERTIEVKPAHTGWVMQSAADCVLPDKDTPMGEVFCLRTTPPEFKTIRTQCLVRPASVRTVCIPAEYQMVRRQVVACPATTRKVCIPAEYDSIEKTVLVCPERVKWEHIVCEDKLTSDTVNKIKSSLLVSGFTPGPLNGKFAREDRVALIAFQQKRGLGVGQLSYETLKELGVSIQ
jgi:hypothetical protein